MKIAGYILLFGLVVALMMVFLSPDDEKGWTSDAEALSRASEMISRVHRRSADASGAQLHNSLKVKFDRFVNLCDRDRLDIEVASESFEKSAFGDVELEQLVDYVGEERLIDIFCSGSLMDSSQGYHAFGSLYNILMRRVISGDPRRAIDAIERIEPRNSSPVVLQWLLAESIASGEHEELLTEIDGRVVRRSRWAESVDSSYVVGGLLEKGYSVSDVIDSLSTIDVVLAERAIMGYYDSNAVDLNTPEGEEVLLFLENADQFNMDKYIERFVALCERRHGPRK